MCLTSYSGKIVTLEMNTNSKDSCEDRNMPNQTHNITSEGVKNGSDTSWRLTSFYGAKYQPMEILSDASDSEYDEDNTFTVVDVGDSVISEGDVSDTSEHFDSSDPLASSDLCIPDETNTHSNFNIKGKETLVNKINKVRNYNYDSSDSDSDNNQEKTIPKHKKIKVEVLSPDSVLPASSGSQAGSSTTTTTVHTASDSGSQPSDTTPITITNSDSQPGGSPPNTNPNSVSQPAETPVSKQQTWACNVRKNAKNHGLSYYTKIKGTNELREMPARKIGNPCNCKNKCFEKVTEEGIESIFKHFWAMGDYNMQNSYLTGRIQQMGLKRKRTKSEESKKTCTNIYTVEFKKKIHIVCREAFLSIHDIKKGRTSTALKKKTEGGGIIKDLRGLNPNTNSRKYSKEVVNCGHNHIGKFISSYNKDIQVPVVDDGDIIKIEDVIDTSLNFDVKIEEDVIDTSVNFDVKIEGGVIDTSVNFYSSDPLASSDPSIPDKTNTHSNCNIKGRDTLVDKIRYCNYDSSDSDNDEEKTIPKHKKLKVEVLSPVSALTASSGSQTGGSIPTTIVPTASDSGSQHRDSTPTTITDSGSQPRGNPPNTYHNSVSQPAGTPISKQQTWACNVRKNAKNHGLSYYTKVKGTKELREMPARKIGKPCNCKNKCFEKVTEVGVESIFKHFWAMGDYNMQNSYLTGRIQQMDLKRNQTKFEESKKTCTNIYTVEFKKKLHTVCKEAFLSMHDIKKGRTSTALKKKTEGGGIIKDLRGLNPNTNKGKYSEEAVNCVHNHIRQLPVTSSHYTRKKKQKRQFLEADLSIRKIYGKYREFMSSYNKNIQVVSLKYYYKIFSNNYNIGFRPVAKDICQKCNRLQFIIAEGIKKAKNVEKYQKEQDEHKAQYITAYNALKAAKQPENNWVSICMDLQQTMPCPKLAVGSAYYKRKLSLYNLCVHDITKDESYMFVWEENNAGRGSVEIFSCLHKWLGDYILNTPKHPRNLRIFADNCGGQNKNLNMTLALLREVHVKHFDRIELCYLVPGHSFMACDKAFGMVEKNLRIYESIMSPEHYCMKIASSRAKKDFPLYHMKNYNFLDIEIFLRDRIACRRFVKDKAFQTAAQIIITHEYPIGFILKKDYHISDEMGEYCSVVPPMGNVESFSLGIVSMPQKYPQERQMNLKKVRDIESLGVYLGEENQWVKDLSMRQKELYGNTAAAAVPRDQDDPAIVPEGNQDQDDVDEQPDDQQDDHGYMNDRANEEFEYDPCVVYYIRSEKNKR
ncbi:unnamed protein product [Meganyctiphanes norvegica]|uniref:DUF7869 domain-containing protein n=1 Tax=Meganyctiphanes norvegica TaxID=48144 RepID=A0AAV2QPL5_MEGNR